MTKQQFVALAETIRKVKPGKDHPKECYAGCYSTWESMRDALADFCASQNEAFDRERWLGYIAGANGKNGGIKK